MLYSLGYVVQQNCKGLTMTKCLVLKDYQADRGIMTGNHLQKCNECQEYFREQRKPPHCQGCEFQRNMKANALSTAKLARVLSESGLDGLAAYIRENTSQNN